MKYGLLEYEENTQFFNVGDNIQSLAAKQFLPQVDEFVNREKLGDYKGEKIKMILNGWFTHNAANWVPSENIQPLFVSFHMNNTAAPLMLSEKGIAYLQKYQPIGCRDQYTVDTLVKNGIDAYFTGCLTLTLDSYKVDDVERNDKIYIVDPLYGYTTPRKIRRNYKTFLRSIQSSKIFELGKRKKHLKSIVSQDVLDSAIYVNQEPPANMYNCEEKFAMAEKLLNDYARAKLVITSRIHCALPCLAMGTPVIFINGFETFTDSSRFEGIIDLFNRIDINTKTGKWSANFDITGKISKNTEVKNLEKHHAIADALKSTCNDFIHRNN